MRDSTGIELAQLLSTVVLSEANILAGHAGLSRRVTRVNVMEVPDVLPWVRAGELLVTTAYPYRDRPEELGELIPELVGRGVACLGIKTHRFIDTVPECALQAANRLDFPIIELPPDTAFSDVVRVLMERIIGTETDGVKEIQSRVQRVIQCLLTQTDTAALLDVVEEAVQCSVAMVHGRTWSASAMLLRLPDSQSWELVQALQAKGISEGEPFMVQSTTRAWRAYAVCAGEFDGSPMHLVAFEGSNLLRPLDVMTLEQVGPLLGLHWMTTLAKEKLLQTPQDQFLREWLSGDIVEATDIMSRAANCGLAPLADEYSVVIATPQPTVSEADLVTLQRTLRRPLMNVGALCTVTEGRLVVLTPGDGRSVERVCRLALPTALSSSVRLIYSSGRRTSSVTGVWSSYLEARQTQSVHGTVHPESTFVTYDEIGIYRALTEGFTPTLARKWVTEWIGPLLRYDASTNMPLIDTLRQFYASNANVKETARRLYTHANTITYRLERIESLLGVDPRDFASALSLQLALKLYDWITPNDAPAMPIEILHPLQ